MKLPPSVARYEQVANDLRVRILRGEWQPGVTLPGAPALSRDYDVTQSVAQKALETLVAWRMARTGSGRGTVVLLLREYRVSVESAQTASRAAGAEIAAAAVAAVERDPMCEDAEAGMANGFAVSALVLAAHPGHAADWLIEILREMPGVTWDFSGASVTARPA